MDASTKATVIIRVMEAFDYWVQLPEYHWIIDSNQIQRDRLYKDCAKILRDVLGEIADIPIEGQLQIDLAAGWIMQEVLTRLYHTRLKYGYQLKSLQGAGWISVWI